MTLVNFYVGTRKQLAETPLTDGLIYFIQDNNSLGEIAYDWDDRRLRVAAPRILTLQNLDNSIPFRGELIVVTDALSTINTDTQEITYTPGLKIGDGITRLNSLPYVNDFYRVDAAILQEQVNQLSQNFNTHTSNTNIHHTINGRISSSNANTLEIVNYNQ